MNPMYRLVDTDNFGGDYPDEKWACLYAFTTERDAEKVANLLNDICNPGMCSSRYVKVVEHTYTLQPGFEP